MKKYQVYCTIGKSTRETVTRSTFIFKYFSDEKLLLLTTVSGGGVTTSTAVFVKIAALREGAWENATHWVPKDTAVINLSTLSDEVRGVGSVHPPFQTHLLKGVFLL